MINPRLTPKQKWKLIYRRRRIENRYFKDQYEGKFFENIINTKYKKIDMKEKNK